MPTDSRSVLVVSASMGAGHDGAARELAAKLVADGHKVEVKDLLDAAPARIGGTLRRGYQLELRYAPGAYDATYRFWYRAPWLRGPLASLVCLLAGRRLLAWVARSDADVVVSTYPLATLCLGRLRAAGRLAVPVVNFITDFGVHPLWVHPGVDLNLAVHETPAATAEHLSGRPALACGPVVSARFGTGAVSGAHLAHAFPEPTGAASERRRRRDEWGLGEDQLAVLVVAGSWGVGDIDDTFESLASADGVVPVVVCGRDASLEAHLHALAQRWRPSPVVIGWSDQMPALMGACDVLVENAGGLTSLEAMRAGLPVVSYRPIAGHGKENTTAMAAAGVSVLAADRDSLVRAVRAVGPHGAARDAQVRAALAMFAGDAAAEVLAVAGRP